MPVPRRRPAHSLVETLVVIAIMAILFTITLSAIQRVRESANRVQCANRLRQIGLALTQYHEEFRELPSGCSYLNGKDPYPFMSWSTRILPYLEQRPLWEKAKAAFTAEKNFRVNPPHIGNIPQPLFLCPSDGREMRSNIAGFTCFLGVEGTDQFQKDGTLYLDSRVRFSEITDGHSNTLMVGERPPSPKGDLGWWYAGHGQDHDGSLDLTLGAREKVTYVLLVDVCPVESNRYRRGNLNADCDALHFWSLHPDGAHFLFVDGSVRLLNYSADSILTALATRAGNEPVSPPE